MEDEMRLQKYLAICGVASRRKCEEYIAQGQVKINGNIVTDMGIKIIPKEDIIEYNGKEIKQEYSNHVYILLNKPIDYVTTVTDQFGRNSVLDLVNINRRIVPVGRLDMYTSGALLLTDDGDFVYRVTHPKHEIAKTYTVTLLGIPSEKEIKILENGVDIGGFITNRAKVKILKTDIENNRSRLEITIHEGKNRQIRKMCEAINKKVLALHRSKIGNIGVKDLELGKWRYLSTKEVKDLLEKF